jgi:hypothetical protein
MFDFTICEVLGTWQDEATESCTKITLVSHPPHKTLWDIYLEYFGSKAMGFALGTTTCAGFLFESSCVVLGMTLCCP